MSNDLVQPSDLAGFPGAPFADGVVDAAVGALRDECGWDIAPTRTAVTVKVDGSGSRIQLIPTLQLGAVTSVTENGTLLDADSYDWSEAGYLERRDGCWTSRPRGIVAVVTHGYTKCPPSLLAVVAALCQLGTVGRAVAAESAGGMSVTYRDLDAGTHLAAERVVSKYRLEVGP